MTEQSQIPREERYDADERARITEAWSILANLTVQSMPREDESMARQASMRSFETMLKSADGPVQLARYAMLWSGSLHRTLHLVLPQVLGVAALLLVQSDHEDAPFMDEMRQFAATLDGWLQTEDVERMILAALDNAIATGREGT
jgi:hypothetical protein